MWGESAISEPGTPCSAVAGGVPILVSQAADEHGIRQRVWYRTGGPHEPIVSAHSAVMKDAPVVGAITLSGMKMPANKQKD